MSVHRAVRIGLLSFVASLAALRSLAGAEPPSLPIARDGKAACRIAVATDASPAEHTAARELADYLRAATGAAFDVVPPAAAGLGALIAVGPGAANAVAPGLDLDRRALGDDGIVLQTVGQHLVLTGAAGSKRGTLYAVYEFLERQVGVRWWSHTEEFVPSVPNLAVAPLNLRYTPPFLYREVFGWGMVQAEQQWGYDDGDAAVKDWAKARFAARLRNNGHGTAMPASLGGCYMPLGWCHTFYPFLPPATYFRDHPEWYSEIGGKRVGENAQLCMTNDAMLAEFAKNVLERVRRQPQLGIVVVTMNDWGGNCQCAACKAMDAAEESPMGSLLYGVNKVAEAVGKEFPELLVATHAYLYARKPPKTLRPRDNVLIWLCVIERSAAQPIDSDANRRLLEDVQGWAKAAPKLFVWDYTMNLPGPLAPHPNWQVFGPDLRTYRDHHAVGVFMESESVGVTHLAELKVYLMAHLLWDPSRDAEAVIDEFLRGYYGPAAPALREVMRVLEASARDVRLVWSQGPDAGWLDLASISRCSELSRQAEEAVAGDPVARARVRRARLAIDHQWLYGYAQYRDDAAHRGLAFAGPADPAAAAVDFAARVRSEVASWSPDAMTAGIPACMGRSFDDYLAELTLLAAAAGRTGPLPPAFRDLPHERVVDMDEARATVYRHAGATIVEDAKAANGLAMRVPQAPAPSWAVQAKTRRLGALGGFGRYRIYIVARCELHSDAGAAFVGGVWDERDRKGLGAVSFPIGRPAPAPPAQAIDAHPEVTFATLASGAPVTDGEYHVYDVGAYDLPHGEISVWVGTTTADLYVDRFIFVREP